MEHHVPRWFYKNLPGSLLRHSSTRLRGHQKSGPVSKRPFSSNTPNSKASSLRLCCILRLGNELADIKRRRAALEASLKNHRVDSTRLQQAGEPKNNFKKNTWRSDLVPLTAALRSVTFASPPTAPPSSAPLDPKVMALSQQLDSLDQDLAKTEEGMQRRLRSPLSRTDPVSDLLNRLKEQEVPPSTAPTQTLQR